MKYVDLFNELQLSRDYIHDKKSSADWRYNVDTVAKRVYVEVQETKTGLDWIQNFKVLPVIVTNSCGQQITVPLGAKQQADAIIADIMDHLVYADFDWYFCGWSQGGMSAGTTGFMLKGVVKSVHYIGWGTPAFLWGKKSLAIFISALDSVVNFLYSNDWIKSLIPLYKRPTSYDVKPINPDNPQTMDQRHRVYGHCDYSTYYEEVF